MSINQFVQQDQSHGPIKSNRNKWSSVGEYSFEAVVDWIRLGSKLPLDRVSLHTR
jgi:hypothetical protein